MDSYQAIYDAVRSKIRGGDIESAIRNAIDISHEAGQVAEEFKAVAYELQRPFILIKPKVFIDGDRWCALYGEVAGFGESPDKASYDFDINWNKKLDN